MLYFLHQPCDEKRKDKPCILTYFPSQPPSSRSSIRPLDRDHRLRLPCLVDKGPRVRGRACLKLERSNKATHMKLPTLRSDAPPISPCRLPKALRIRFTSNGRKSEVVGCIWLVFVCLFIRVQRRRRQAGGLESESGTVLTRSGKDEKKMRGKHAHFDASFPTAAVRR